MIFVAVVVYVVLQVLLLPLAIIGVSMVAWRQIQTSQKLGLSGTAIEIINGRWTMDVFGLRHDKASRKLARKLPNTSVLGLWMALLPLYILYRMTGKNFIYPRIPEEGKEGIADLVMSRTVFIDGFIDDFIEARKGAASQFVALGAGLDTRAYGPLKDSGLSFFELDQAVTQKMKRSRLKKAKIRSAHVKFVEVDFTEEDWISKLTKAGFDPARPAIFLWEGVTLYLSEAEVAASMAAIKSVAAEGSVLIADFYAARFVKMAGKGVAKDILEATGEGLGFGLDFSGDFEAELNRFVTAQGMKLANQKFLGATTKKGPYAVVAEILI